MPRALDRETADAVWGAGPATPESGVADPVRRAIRARRASGTQKRGAPEIRDASLQEAVRLGLTSSTW
ncbi:hypothetical protein GCM10009750_08450 [Agromyces salentinus]|uniref:Uncharacterized protein n=1 Tax=Agromyces salentinus TaxID=269421 RepID=A0ABN2MJR8_9MICO